MLAQIQAETKYRIVKDPKLYELIIDYDREIRKTGSYTNNHRNNFIYNNRSFHFYYNNQKYCSSHVPNQETDKKQDFNKALKCFKQLIREFQGSLRIDEARAWVKTLEIIIKLSRIEIELKKEEIH